MQKEVLHTLTRYLSVHDVLGIAGVGYLRRIYRPARFVGNQLKAPGSSWFYEAEKSVAVTDAAFLQCFTTTATSAIQAEKELQEFFEAVFNAVVLKGNFSHPGLGTFLKQKERIALLPDAANYVDSLSPGFESLLVKLPQKDVKLPATDQKTLEAESLPMEKRGVSLNQWLRIAAAVLILISVNFLLINYLEYSDTSTLQQTGLGDFENIDSGITAPHDTGETDTLATTPDSTPSGTGLQPENQLARTESIPLLEARPAKFALPIVHQFAVIVGAFKELQNAERYVKTLSDQGYEAHLAGSTTGGLYRVSAGSFDEMKIADSFAETLKTQNQIDAWVMEVNK